MSWYLLKGLNREGQQGQIAESHEKTSFPVEYFSCAFMMVPAQ